MAINFEVLNMDEKIRQLIKNTIIDIRNIQSVLENNPNKTIYMYKKCQSANDKLATLLQHYDNEIKEKQDIE